MASQNRQVRSGFSIRGSDLFAQFRWLLVLLGANLVLLVAGVVFDSVLGYPVFGAIIVAFASVAGSVVLVLGLVLFAYRTL